MLTSCRSPGGDQAQSGAGNSAQAQGDPPTDGEGPTSSQTPSTGEAEPAGDGTTGGELDMPPLPSAPLPPIEVLASDGACPSLPKVPTDATDDRRDAAEIARVLHALACRPSLHAMTSEAARAAIGDVPDWISIDLFEGGARLDPERRPSAKQLAEALGVSSPVARLEWQAYHDQWYLGSSVKTGRLEGYGPGSVTVMLSLDADDGDPPGKVIDMPSDTELRGVFMVAMPESAVKMGPDPEGMKQLTAAIRLLARRPALLDLEPAAKLGMDTERWRFAEVSRSSGNASTHGVSIDPQRTRVPADELARALGIANATAMNVNREHDVWKMRAGGSTEIALDDIELSVSVAPEQTSDRETSLDGVSATFIMMLPR